MTGSYADANAVQRLARRFAASRPGSWLFARILDHADRVVFRASRGRTTLAALLSGLPVMMLTTTGARSGRETTVPILGFEEGDAVVVVASNYGQPRHPAWLHNLRAHPRARLEVRGVWRDVVAEEVESPERERYLAIASEVYPGYRSYEKRAAPRRISVFRLIGEPGRAAPPA
jgi:deazaflavin-dependent oxidoreductase (nitroreductase family)